MSGEKINKKIQQLKNRIFSFPIAPYRQFKNLIIASIVLFVILAISHYSLFYKVKFVDTTLVPDANFSEPMPSINQTKLDAILSDFKQREDYRKTIVNLTPLDTNPAR